MDVAASMKAVVVSGEGNQMPVPEHKVMLVATETADEAHYLAAVLNSRPFNTVVTGYIVDNSVSTHPMENIVVPKFRKDDPLHVSLAKLSREAHQASLEGLTVSVEEIEKQIGMAVERLWDID
jgi:hypothetical protein